MKERNRWHQGYATTAIGDSDPIVERAVPDFDPIDFPVWIVTHRDVARSRRLRVVFDALVEGFGG